MPEPSRRSSETAPAMASWARGVAVALGLYALVGGLVSMTGWAADIPPLTDWEGKGVSIQPLASLAAILAGMGVLALVAGRPFLTGVLGLIVAALGISAITQTAAGINLGIDTLLMFGRDWGQLGTVSPGRMGIPGAVSWSLLGTAIVLSAVSLRSQNVGRPRMSGEAAVVLALVALSISLLSLIGYLYGAEALYMIPRVTVIAVQTSSFIFAVAAGLLLTMRDFGLLGVFSDEGPGSTLARRIIPAIILVPVGLGLVALAGTKNELYDVSFKSAIRTLAEIALLSALVLWTARTINKQARRASERELEIRQLADAMPQVVWIADEDGKVVYYNAQVAGFGGVNFQEERPYDWQPFIHPDDVKDTSASWTRALEENRPYAHEHRIQMADGSFRWHLSRAFPSIGADGKAEKWFGTATDIHDLKLAEQELRESEQRFSRFMHHLPGLAWIKDRDGRYVYANDAALRAFRMSKALYGRKDEEVFPPDIAASFRNNDREALESPTGIQVIENLENELGELRQSLVSKFPIPLADGSGPLIGGMAIDVTEQRRAEEDREFLFRIAEKIRVADEPQELLAYVSKAVGEYLKVHRCLFNEIDLEHDRETVRGDFSRDGQSIAGTYPISAYSPVTSHEMSHGHTVVNHDAAHDERTAQVFETTYGPSKELAYVAVPMLREGCSDDKPRNWTEREVELLENIAERTWVAVERLRATALLRESAERYRLAQQAGNVGIWDWDITAGRTYWSEQMWELYDEEPRADDPDVAFWNSHLHPDDAELALQRFEAALASSMEQHRDVFRTMQQDGSVKWIASMATIIRDEMGKPLRMYGVNLDITAMKAIEQELQKARGELEVRVEKRTRELAEANVLLRKQMEERARVEDHRISLLKKLFTMQEDERGRIARDIHDQLGQRLTALRLKIAAVKDLCRDDEVLYQRVSRLQEISELLDSEVSFLAWELRPSILNETDFESALEQYVREWSRFSGIFAEVDRIGVGDVRIDKEIATNLYRITQEALNNVAKYAQADVVNVLLEKREDDLILIIEDNGVGFDQVSLDDRAKTRRGFGLVGMRERAAMISGTFELESTVNEGTTIFVRVPLNKNGVMP
jgi:PAS domain S-box-containing protein